MNTFFDNSLKEFLANRSDLFGEGSKYVGFEIETEFSSKCGYNSTITFGKIVYQRENQKCKSKSITIKQTPPKRKIFSDAENFHATNESFFYNRLQPFFNSYKRIDFFPEFLYYKLQVSVTGKEDILILENLQAFGYRPAERESFLDYDHLSLMLRKLGNFHAYSFKAKKENPVDFRTLCDLFVSTYVSIMGKLYNHLSFVAAIVLRSLQHQQSQYSYQLLTAKRYLKNMPGFLKQLCTNDKNDPTSVLCHGAYQQCNVLFKYENTKPVDVKIIDFALCTLASPVLDLARILYMNADQRMRDEHWDELIDEYHTGLTEPFEDVAVPSREDIIAQFRGKAFVAFFIASYRLIHTIAIDNNLPSFDEIAPARFRNMPIEEIPPHEFSTICSRIGGSMAFTALTDILKDMMARKFI